MRAVIQRVKWAKVSVDGRVVGEIGPGILTLLGVGINDTESEAE
jgi:D-tyrosyl-tRNA(Tyr) deacylase